MLTPQLKDFTFNVLIIGFKSKRDPLLIYLKQDEVKGTYVIKTRDTVTQKTSVYSIEQNLTVALTKMALLMSEQGLGSRWDKME